MNRTAGKKKWVPFKNFIYDFVMLTGALPGFIWFRPKYVFESEKAKERIKGGALLVSNHLSIFDPIYLMFAVWYRRQHFVCAKELCRNKFISWFFKNGGCIPIDRENPDFDSMREIIASLKNDEIVSIFPEGHINEEESTLDSFKSGPVLMSVTGGKPIVPLYIKRRPGFCGRLIVIKGEAIDFMEIYGKRPNGAQLAEIAEKLREKEQKLMRIYEEKYK